MDKKSKRNEIVSLLQKAADGRDHVSQPEFVRLTGISKHQVDKHFPDGGYTELLRLAGSSVYPNRLSLEVSDDDVLSDFHRIAEEMGTLPKWSQIEARSRLTRTITRTRFATKEKLLLAYKAWLERHDPNSNFLSKVDSELLLEATVRTPSNPENQSTALNLHQAGAGVFYGELLNFRGL